jgi:hypothetical protein
MRQYDIRINTACGKSCGWHDLRCKYIIPISKMENIERLQHYCKLFAAWLDSYQDGPDQFYQCKAMCARMEKEPEGEF